MASAGRRRPGRGAVGHGRRRRRGGDGASEYGRGRVTEHSAAPGVEDWPAAWRPVPRRDDVDGLDRPVWHEGASTRGESVIRVRADILGIKPPLWRRLELRGSLTLDKVHPVFAAAFGWAPEAEYRFCDVVRVDGATRLGCLFVNEWTRGRGHLGPQEWTVRLDQVLSGPRSRLRYTYGRPGFGVTVVAEDVMPAPPAEVGEVPAARLLTGRRAGPPQDFASAAMYDMATQGRFPASLADLLHISSLPEDYDPEAIDLALLDARVRAAAES
ncbi:plasmid pRiA4b ORF-3 family protein [Mobilicoccus caccae]|uniref:plasmid pRiA4b ORF-3 family protein n=1 Tax=Mobilicoccus caccae TaxID=1859295 RepID=UPI0024E10D20|nr:plasmid pRiA4b ORF-3 family protein [Mobilicoccus caccae]